MRCLLLTAAVLALLLSAAGCTSDPDPARRGSAAGPDAPPARSVPPQPARVVEPWRADMPERGVNIYWENSTADDDVVVRAKAARILDYVVALGANAVAFSFPFYTTGITSNTVRADRKTPGPERIRIALDEADRRGLRSSVRPILNETVLTEQDPKAWRGTIAPSDRDAWFRGYREFLLPYAEAAQDATTFVVGTELNSLEGDPRWKRAVVAIRAVFPGQVSYSANFDSYQKGRVDVPADHIGVDAYPRFDLRGDASTAEVTTAWTRWLRAHDSDGPPVLHEVGIAAQAGALRRPGHWGDGSRALDLDVQRRWYEGICQALRDGAAGGVYWWKVDFDADPATAKAASADRMTFLARPAEETVRDCFAHAF